MKTTWTLLGLIVLIGCGGDGFEAGAGAGSAGSAGSEQDADLEDGGDVEASPDAYAWPDASPDAPIDVTSPEAGPDAPQDAPVDVQDATPDTTEDTTVDAPVDAPVDVQVQETGPEACVPITCASAGKDCGPLPDGCGATLDCGSCPTNMSCGGGGTPNVCGGCVPVTCDGVQQFCGLLLDGCGNTLDCGPYKRGYDPSCQSPSKPYSWYCDPEQYWAPPPFPTGCVQSTTWPGLYCCSQGD